MRRRTFTPEQLTRIRSQKRRWQKANWDWLKVKQREHRKQRYAQDPVYREKRRAIARQYHERVLQAA